MCMSLHAIGGEWEYRGQKHVGGSRDARVKEHLGVGGDGKMTYSCGGNLSSRT